MERVNVRYWCVSMDENLRIVMAEAMHGGFADLVVNGEFHGITKPEAERLRDVLNVMLVSE